MNTVTDLNKWNLLLEQTEIKYESYDGNYQLTGNAKTSTTEDLTKFEKTNRIILPQEYKEFCQVFGDGEFGYTQFAINIPGQQEGEEIAYVRQTMIETYQDIKESVVSGSFRYGISTDARSKIENSYRFGTGQGYINFVFDLTSYSEIDLSYDIYAFKCDSHPSHIFLGRDFFEFIKDFCLGERAELEFPDFFVFEYDDDEDDDPISKPGTFFPCFLSLESEDS